MAQPHPLIFPSVRTEEPSRAPTSDCTQNTGGKPSCQAGAAAAPAAGGGDAGRIGRPRRRSGLALGASRALRGRRPALTSGAAATVQEPMTVSILILGALLGAVGVAVYLHRDRERTREALKAISLDVLAQTGDSLAQRISEARRAEEERAAGEMARRAEEIRGLVVPVNEKLGRMESEIGRLERERRQAQGELAQMVRHLGEGVGTLRQETGNLVSALKRPATRGSWGEIQLRNVVEMAGMVSHCDFVEQSTIQTDEGPLRPDMLVRLPAGKLVVVDSKVPLDAYLSALESASEDERERQTARHARQTRDHIAKLAAKGYQRQFDSTPEFVVMFVPSDGIYHAALAQDPALIEYGVSQQVLMATPTTLIGLLWAVHYGWRQELIAESAREIAESASELHRRLGRFVEPLAKLGRQLDGAVTSYNEAVGSFDHRVMPQLRRIEQAGAASDREVLAPGALEAAARMLTARPEPEPEGQPAPPPPSPEEISVERIARGGRRA
jgi:DNA recombination protein RmuC